MSPAQLRRDLTATIWHFNNPDSGPALMPIFPAWRLIFHYAAEQAAGQRVVLVLDEFPYAAASDLTHNMHHSPA